VVFGSQTYAHGPYVRQAQTIPFWNQLTPTASLTGVTATPAKKKSLFSPRYDKFLKLLKEARIAAGLSQRDAAKKLSRTQSFISKSESGERRVDVIELVDFLRVYGVRPEQFIKRL
jgi:ribosome-binding protein aMBF1 (putative translation factor)